MGGQRDLEGIYLPLPDRDLARRLESLHVGCDVVTRDDREAAEAYWAAHPDEATANDAWMQDHLPELAARREGVWYGRQLGLTPEEADQLDALLRQARLPLSVARPRLERSTEAWVWVEIASEVATCEPIGYRWQLMLAALAGTQAVLTWNNCD